MLSLHNGPFTSVCWTLLFLVLTVIGIIVAKRSPRASWARFGCVILVIVTSWYALTNAVIGIKLEGAYDARDAAIKTELGDAGIRVVEFRDDQHVVVRRDDCFAVYTIQNLGVLQEGAWPLVVGTGQSLSGCTSGELDAKFIRTS
jgi:hypothetical protein